MFRMTAQTTLTFEELQRLNSAFAAGGARGGFETTVEVMKEFAIRLNDARDGSDDLRKAFAEIGINPFEIDATTEGLTRLLRGINQVDDASRRIQLLDRFFGGDRGRGRGGVLPTAHR